MEVLIFNNETAASEYAAQEFSKRIQHKATTVLGLATGSTPLKMYRELSLLHQSEGLDFSKVNTFNLDEYIGLSGDHPCSYKHFMNENFFNHINISESNVHLPDGMTKDVPKTCQEYEEAIKKVGGIDIQVLGIGSDGHIGFNEPTSSLSSRTRIKTLTKKTCEDNARFFNSIDEVPRHCITMGIATIMEARRIVLLAFGEAKAPAVSKMVEGPLSAMVPASILQMHPNVVVVLDRSAASKLSHHDYYYRVATNKPNWQRL